MAEHRRAKLIAASVLVAFLALVATALVLGGHSGSGEDAGSASSSVGSPPAVHGSVGSNGARSALAPAEAVPSAPSFAAGAQSPSTGGVQVQSAADSVTATRVVKTGSLDLRVDRGQVQPTLLKLVSLTNGMGGYVSQSRTNSVLGAPTGELTLRMPVNQFDTAVSGDERLGHVVSLTTNAHDVTGQVVDLGARVAALEQTRATYLTILGRATTIGATLEVQQRVEDVQQQIEELQGELKVLRNQSVDATLTVDVSQAGSVVPPVHHTSGGIGKAWHTSIDRFSRGFDAIVSALGPLLLAILLLALLAGIGVLGYRGVRRITDVKPT
jgi:hypothetical protein